MRNTQPYLVYSVDSSGWGRDVFIKRVGSILEVDLIASDLGKVFVVGCDDGSEFIQDSPSEKTRAALLEDLSDDERDDPGYWKPQEDSESGWGEVISIDRNRWVEKG